MLGGILGGILGGMAGGMAGGMLGGMMGGIIGGMLGGKFGWLGKPGGMGRPGGRKRPLGVGKSGGAPIIGPAAGRAPGRGGMLMGIPGITLGRRLRISLCLARRRSEALPCRSPLTPSFLYAYEQWTGRLHRNCPFMASIAASADSKLSNATKPKPRDAPVSSVTILADKTAPKALKVSDRSFSSQSTSRFPTKILAAKP